MNKLTMTGEMRLANHQHPVYTLLNTQYLSMRPIVEQIGLNWAAQKKVLLDDYEVRLFGTLIIEDRKIIQPPSIYPLKINELQSINIDIPVEVAVFHGDELPEDTVFIRAKTVFMYILRIDLDEASHNSAPNALENIYQMQEELTAAIHNYEINGVAVKNPGVQS